MLIIPEYDEENRFYPGDIQPGYYTRNEVAALLRRHKRDPEVIQFIADMLEE